MRGIEDQISSMRERWPGFMILARGPHSVIWQGHLAPTKRRYLTRVGYKPPYMGQVFKIGAVQPQVTIVNPILESHPDYEEGPIPHVYRNPDHPSHPILCLFSPEGAEWTLDDSIAETTMYWAARWLFFYEGWLATKKWFGGGRHPTRGLQEAKQLEAV